MVKRDELERSLDAVLDSFGVRALRGSGTTLRIHPDRDGYELRVALPLQLVKIELDHMQLKHNCASYVLKQLDAGRRALFCGVVEHIAKHDHSPLDRVRDIEVAAKALLDALGVHLDDIRMPHGSSTAVANAAYQLRQLIEHKTGAASWSKGGYGADPPQVQEISP